MLCSNYGNNLEQDINNNVNVILVRNELPQSQIVPNTQSVENDYTNIQPSTPSVTNNMINQVPVDKI